MDQPLQRPPMERAPEDVLLTEIIRTLARHYRLIAAATVVALLAVLAHSQFRATVYTSEGLIIVNQEVTNLELTTSLMREQGIQAVPLPGGLLRITAKDESGKTATLKLNSAIAETHNNITSSLSAYERKIADAQAQREQLTALIDQAESVEEKLSITTFLVENLRFISELESARADSAQVFTVIQEPTARAKPEPRFIIRNFMIAIVLGLTAGAIWVYFVENKGSFLDTKPGHTKSRD